MKHIILGFGSIGKRHYNNLLKLIPEEDEIVTVDLDAKTRADVRILDYEDVEGATVYICTPTKWHSEQIAFCHYAHAIFVEKPMLTIEESDNWGTRTRDQKLVVGYQYRFHPEISHLKKLSSPFSRFDVRAADNLLDHYGPTALETMCSHAIDYALWINGPAYKWRVDDSGKEAYVFITHTQGCETSIHCDIDHPTRILDITTQRGSALSYVSVPASNQMYEDEMIAWLRYLSTGEMGDLCSYEEALAVQRVMQG